MFIVLSVLSIPALYINDSGNAYESQNIIPSGIFHANATFLSYCGRWWSKLISFHCSYIENNNWQHRRTFKPPFTCSTVLRIWHHIKRRQAHSFVRACDYWLSGMLVFLDLHHAMEIIPDKSFCWDKREYCHLLGYSRLDSEINGNYEIF